MRLHTFALAFVAVVAGLWTTLADAADRPNIVFIFSDDHAYQAISAYGGPLASIAPTPHIDRLAREGMVFDRCFVTNSLCGPSRAVSPDRPVFAQERLLFQRRRRVRRLADHFPQAAAKGRLSNRRSSANGTWSAIRRATITGTSSTARASITIRR